MAKRRRYQKREDRNLKKDEAGRWFYDVIIGGRRYKKIMGPSKTHARAALEDLKATKRREFENGLGTCSGRSLTFVEYSKTYEAKYIGDKKQGWKKRSAEQDALALRLHLKPFFGKFPLPKIRRQTVEDYIEKRKTEKTILGHTPVKGATINRELALLRAMLNRARRDGFIMGLSFDWRDVKKLPERRRKRILTDSEREALLREAAAAGGAILPFAVIALKTGLRSSEILGLTWDQVDFARRELIIRREKKKDADDSEDRIPVNKDVLALLEGMAKTDKSSGFVFFNPSTGTHIGSVRKAFKAICNRAKIANCRIHDLRRTAATLAYERGALLTNVQRMLGHASLTMTEIYLGLVPDSFRRDVDLLADDYDGDRGLQSGPETCKKHVIEEQPAQISPDNKSIN